MRYEVNTGIISFVFLTETSRQAATQASVPPAIPIPEQTAMLRARGKMNVKIYDASDKLNFAKVFSEAKIISPIRSVKWYFTIKGKTIQVF